jgi:hypothetical protein
VKNRKEYTMSKPIPASVEANRAKFREQGVANRAARATAHADLIAGQKAIGASNRETRAANLSANVEKFRAIGVENAPLKAQAKADRIAAATARNEQLKAEAAERKSARMSAHAERNASMKKVAA